MSWRSKRIVPGGRVDRWLRRAASRLRYPGNAPEGERWVPFVWRQASRGSREEAARHTGQEAPPDRRCHDARFPRALPGLALRQEETTTSYDLTIALLKGKEDRRARAVAERARGRFPGNADLLLASAIAAYVTGSDAEAESFLEQALTSAPDAGARASLLGVLGDLYKSMARFDAALRAMDL